MASPTLLKLIKMSPLFAVFITLIAVAVAQAPADAPKYNETVKLFTMNQEGKWTGIVIRKKTVDITFIPEGATDNTWVDHWMSGHYSTLIQSDGELYFELSITHHIPSFNSNWYYMIWLQLYDEYLTDLKNDSEDYWESYACTI